MSAGLGRRCFAVASAHRAAASSNLVHLVVAAVEQLDQRRQHLDQVLRRVEASLDQVEEQLQELEHHFVLLDLSARLVEERAAAVARRDEFDDERLEGVEPLPLDVKHL